jgi:hypothetical protein
VSYGLPLPGHGAQHSELRESLPSWNCEAPKSKRSSFHKTICVLGTVSIHPKKLFKFQCDAANADPVCELSPYYGLVTDAVAQADRPLATGPLVFRTDRNSTSLFAANYPTRS